VLVEQGRLAEAQKPLEEARDVWRNSGNRDAQAYALYNLGSVAKARGDLLAARQRHQEALSIQQQLAEQVPAGQSQLSLATLSLEEGHPEAALAPTRQALEVFRTNKAVDDEADADLLLARILLEMHQRSEAAKAIAQTRILAAKSQDPRVRLNLAIIAARVAGAPGGLAATVTEARRLGLRFIEFDARLALGEIELTSGNFRSGRATLASLKRDAQAAGFGLIATKVERSLE